MKSFAVLLAVLCASTEAFTVQPHQAVRPGGVATLRMTETVEPPTSAVEGEDTPKEDEPTKDKEVTLEDVEMLGRGAAKVRSDCPSQPCRRKRGFQFLTFAFFAGHLFYYRFHQHHRLNAVVVRDPL